ncbi:MAG: VOC family protein [Actinobacteria bacterium]|nr:VOC family protein [Actinomycetota bacterium]
MLKATRVAATLAVSDIDRARRFYEDVLGFSVYREDPNGIVYEVPGAGANLFIYPSQFAGTNQATAATFEVQDIEATVATLREKGVAFEEYDFPGLKTEEGIATLGPEKAAWFKDPDGNILAVGTEFGI